MASLLAIMANDFIERAVLSIMLSAATLWTHAFLGNLTCGFRALSGRIGRQLYSERHVQHIVDHLSLLAH